MSNVNAVLAALMTATASGLSEAVKVGKRMESEIFASTLSLTTVSAYRVGRAMLNGETAEDKEKKFGNAFAEFQNHFIAAGNAVFRDSDTLQEFKNIKTAIRKGETVPGTMVRAYIARAREDKLTKKEHAIAEVQSLARKLHDDSYLNHADVMREIAGMEDIAAIAARWEQHVRENYAGTYLSLKAALKKEGTSGKSTDKVKAATDLLLAITDASELSAIIKRLQARADEMTSVVAAVLKPVAPVEAPKVDETETAPAALAA